MITVSIISVPKCYLEGLVIVISLSNDLIAWRNDLQRLARVLKINVEGLKPALSTIPERQMFADKLVSCPVTGR